MAKKRRYSRQRERLYEYLTRSKEHPSAERIYLALRGELPDLSLGTVYRNLKLLEEMGKVRRVIAHQGNERYDAICSDHVHLICQQCGSIVDVAETVPEEMLRWVSLEDGYQVSRQEVVLTGCCPLCAQESTA